jgi:hypothetical protein
LILNKNILELHGWHLPLQVQGVIAKSIDVLDPVGRQPGQRVKADCHQKRALELVAARQSYREVGLRLGISKNTVLDIVKRHRADQAGP